MKILITGSSGFVGKHLSEALGRKHKIIKYDLKNRLDVLDEKKLLGKMKGVDLVIHLAAFVSAEESWRKPKEYMRNNSLGTLSVVRNAIKAGVKRLIFFSSAAVKVKPITPYAVSKMCAEDITALYRDKINVIIIRPENIYGKGQNPAYAGVIEKFISAVKRRKGIEIYGSGKQSRDFIFIGDVVKVVAAVLNKKMESGTVIEAGTGKSVKISDLAKFIMKVADKKVSVTHLPKRNEPFSSRADTKALKELGIDPRKFKKFQVGLSEMYKSI